MITNTDGYNALIEYLAENIALFIEQDQEGLSEEDIDTIVTDLMTTNIMSIFMQNKNLSSELRFELTKEADRVLFDLEEVLAGVWSKKAGRAQVLFLEEFISLMKNLFDSTISDSESNAQ